MLWQAGPTASSTGDPHNKPAEGKSYTLSYDTFDLSVTLQQGSKRIVAQVEVLLSATLGVMHRQVASMKQRRATKKARHSSDVPTAMQ